METDRIKATIETCLSHLTVTFTDIEVVTEGAHTLFVVRTDDSGLLIGASGENLKALNSVVRRLVERSLGPDRTAAFMVDVNGYYGKKIRDIKQQAKLLAQRARTFRADVELSPMNAYERMIVHALFTDDPDVYTESRGEGRARHIVIRYRTPEKSLLPSDTSYAG